MSDLSNIVDKATDAIVNGQTLSTDNLNDLAKIFYASANRIIEAIDKSAGLHREIVQQLPTEDIDDTAIYMVLDPNASGSDIYDEWMWIENAWEHIGSTRVDLSDYYTKTEVDTALNGKANVATSIAGYGITDAYTKTEVDTALGGKANTSDIPTTLAGLSDDSTHRVVTDTEKTTWNGKASTSDIETINNQLDGKHFRVYTKTLTNLTIDQAWGGLYAAQIEQKISFSDLELTSPPEAVILSIKDTNKNYMLQPTQFGKVNVMFRLISATSLTGLNTTIHALVIY